MMIWLNLENYQKIEVGEWDDGKSVLMMLNLLIKLSVIYVREYSYQLDMSIEANQTINYSDRCIKNIQ